MILLYYLIIGFNFFSTPLTVCKTDIHAVQIDVTTLMVIGSEDILLDVSIVHVLMSIF